MKFYDAWESLGAQEREREVKKRLLEYVEYARSSAPFYKERLKDFDVGAPHPLLGVPGLESSVLRENVLPKGRGLLAGGDNGYTVFQSGGTTGTPKAALFSHQEIEDIYLPNARGFHAVGLTSSDRVANLWAVGSLYMTFVHMNNLLQRYGCVSFPFSNHTPSEFVFNVKREFEIRCFTGIASVVLTALREMKAAGATRDELRVEKIYYGGEHVYEADKRELVEEYGAQVIAAPGYGTVDSWYIGYQCSETPTGVFHVHDDQAYVEIVDDVTGEPVEAGAPGMLYVTAFPRRLTPIVRYRVGDLAEWCGHPCPCGRGTPLLKLLGRGDDVLRIGYDSVDYAAVQKIVSEIGQLSGTVQMEKQRVEGRDLLIVRVETELPGAAREAVAHKLLSALLRDRPSLRQFVEKGSVHTPRVELVAHGSLPRNERTGKLRRVIDAL